MEDRGGFVRSDGMVTPFLGAAASAPSRLIDPLSARPTKDPSPSCGRPTIRAPATTHHLRLRFQVLEHRPQLADPLSITGGQRIAVAVPARPLAVVPSPATGSCRERRRAGRRQLRGVSGDDCVPRHSATSGIRPCQARKLVSQEGETVSARSGKWRAFWGLFGFLSDTPKRLANRCGTRISGQFHAARRECSRAFESPPLRQSFQ